MRTVDEIMQVASKLGACKRSHGVSNWKSLVWLFFTPQGREFCEENNFPSLALFQEMKENICEHGVFVDAGSISKSNPCKIGVIGNTYAIIIVDDNTKVHQVILMHGAKARIMIKNYSIVRLINIGNCFVEIDNDGTSVILK